MSLYITLLLSPLEQIIGLAFEVLESEVSETTNKVEADLSNRRDFPEHFIEAFITLRKCLSRDKIISIEITEDEALYDRFNSADELYQEFVSMLFNYRHFIKRKK